jgi:hypothetical protein
MLSILLIGLTSLPWDSGWWSARLFSGLDEPMSPQVLELQCSRPQRFAPTKVLPVGSQGCYRIRSASGTICGESDVASAFWGFPFTYCRFMPNYVDDGGDGLAILPRTQGPNFNFTYSTVLNCAGSTGIDITTATPPAISCCKELEMFQV